MNKIERVMTDPIKNSQEAFELQEKFVRLSISSGDLPATHNKVRTVLTFVKFGKNHMAVLDQFGWNCDTATVNHNCTAISVQLFINDVEIPLYTKRNWK